MLNTWGQLLVLALVLTFFSMRYNRLPLAIIAMLGWLAMWNYNLGTPPTGIAVGSFGHDLLTYIFIIAAVAVFLFYIANRNRIPSGYNRTAGEQARYDREYEEAKEAPLNGEEAYRRRVHRALHPRIRRR